MKESNGKIVRKTEVPSKTTNNKIEEQKIQEIGDVEKQNPTFLKDVHSSMLHDEATRDTAIDAQEIRIIDAHMKLLEDHNIPLEKRQEILNECYARIDKKREYESENKREHTKRFNRTLWMATFTVLGTSAIKYAPEIIEAIFKNRRA